MSININFIPFLTICGAVQVRWSYGVKLLSAADPETTETEIEETTPLLGENAHGRQNSYPHTGEPEDVDVSRLGIHHCTPTFRRHITYYNSFPNSPNLSRTDLSQYEPTSPNDEDQLPGFDHRPEVGIFGKIRKSVLHVLKAIHGFMTVPLWASLASIVVACAPPLQYWLQHSAHPLNGAISSAGNCSIPVTLVVLGAYFYPEAPESENNTPKPPPSMLATNQSTSTLASLGRGLSGKANHVESSNPPRKAAARKGETKTVIVSIMSRMILTPLTLMPLVIFSAKYDFHAVFEEYVFRSLSPILN